MEKKKKVIIGVLVMMQVLILAGLTGVFFQNKSLAGAVQQYVASAGNIHEVYDDTDVIEAYKSGKADELNEQDKFVLSKAKEIIKEVIKKDMTDFEKEKAIYDWQVGYIAFNDDTLAPISSGDQYSHLPYGVLKYRQAICVGNATTFKLFMDMLGIENQIIHSVEAGEHAWNLIKLDGDWYHSDVTFDNGLGGMPAYQSFNVPDSVKDNGSYPWNHEEIPAADGTKYCYLANQAKELKDIYQLPKYIKEQLKKKNAIIAFKLKDATGYTQEIANFLATASTTGDAEVLSNVPLVVGDETIYLMGVTSIDMGYANKDVEKAMNKLQEIIDGLQ